MFQDIRASVLSVPPHPCFHCAMAKPEVQQRRSLRYIRLAAHFASQPIGVDRVELTIPEIEQLLANDLPIDSRQPSWWRNDRKRMHSRAWLTAGWEVTAMDPATNIVVFERSN